MEVVLMGSSMTWEDLQGIPLEQQLRDLASDYQGMSALLDQAVSDPEAFLELCHQAQREVSEALAVGDRNLIADMELAAERALTLRNIVRCFTVQRLVYGGHS
jgi:hypothetical protein